MIVSPAVDVQEENNQHLEANANSTPESEIKKADEKTEEQRLFKKIFKILYACILDTTMHGLPRVLSTEYIALKIIWGICVLISSGICLWLIIYSIMVFFKYDYESSADYAIEIPTKFPAVSICNDNTYTSQSAIEFINQLLSANNISVQDRTNTYFHNDLLKFMFLHYMTALNAFNPLINDTLRLLSMKLDLNQTLISCTYNVCYILIVI